jgi:hypothetical protein
MKQTGRGEQRKGQMPKNALGIRNCEQKEQLMKKNALDVSRD